MLTSRTGRTGTAGAGRLIAGLLFALALLLCASAAGEELALTMPEDAAAGRETGFVIRYDGEDPTCEVTASVTALYANGTAALLDAERKTLSAGEEWRLELTVPYACRVHLEADGVTGGGLSLHREAFAEVNGEGADWPELTLNGPDSCLTGEEAVFSVTPRGGAAPYTVRMTAYRPGEGPSLPFSQTWRSDGEAVYGTFSFPLPGQVRFEAEVTDARGLKAYAEGTWECREAPLRLEADRTDLTEGDSVGLRVFFGGQKWAFSSSDPAVAQVDENGRVTAAGPGTAVVTAADGDGAEASLLFRILPEAQALTVEGLSLQPGQSGQLRPVLEPAGAMVRYLYLSADETVASVDENGVVTAGSPGRTAVTVIAVEKPSLSVTAEITVADEAQERVRAFAYGLFFSGGAEGGELAAAYGAVSGGKCGYTLTLSRDGQVLSVKSREESGVIRFYLPDPVPGTYRIAVTARDEAGCLAGAAAEGVLAADENGRTLTAAREDPVPVLVEKLTLLGPRLVYTGQAVSYAAEARPASAPSGLRWESRNPDVASVDENGVLTVLGEGFTVLSVSALDGSGAKAEMTVECVAETLSLGAGELVIHRGDSMELNVTSGTGRVYAYSYASSDPGLFRVSPDGVVTALAEGRGTLTVACANGACEAAFPVRVIECLHREGTWRVTKEATCLNAGERVFVCAFCGETARTETVPALAHDAGRWATRLPATPRYAGERIRRCTRCGAVLERDALPCITEDTYNLNTACAEGFSFRDMFRVKEWYMFTPLDVGHDGVHPLRLIASNMYQIGTVYVTVLDGRIRVTYQLVNPALKFSDEFITFLPGLEAFRGADPAFYRNYAFGIWYDLEEDLGCGDGLTLLFIRNRLNYEKGTPGMVMFGEEQPTHLELLRRLIWLLDDRFGG